MKKGCSTPGCIPFLLKLVTYTVHSTPASSMRFTLLFSLLAIMAGKGLHAQIGPPAGYSLVWSDEFAGTGSPNTNLWFHQTQLPAGGSWFNGELQHYTSRMVNSSVGNGVLKITARRESFSDQGQTKQFTSARLNSKFAFTYGQVDVRAKLPAGSGTWPAIWC